MGIDTNPLRAKPSLPAFIKSLGLRPQDTGEPEHGAGNYNFSLGVNFG
jgi:hypothetical protein